MMRHATITATSGYLPAERVTNADLRARFECLGRATDIDRFEATSGIRQRWYAEDDQATSDLALAASRQALAKAGLGADALDILIVASDTPDYITPATATVLQAKLGAWRAGTFDVSCACAAFPTALANAAGLIATNRGIRRVLVVGAYLMHRFADPADPMIFFYGDGAGAALVEASDEPGLLASAFRADGRYAEHWGIAAGGTAEPASAEAVSSGRTRVQLRERYPPEINEQGWPALLATLLDNGGLQLHDLAAIIFTQINQRTIERVCQQLDYPLTRAPLTMTDVGYTGSACLPIALDRSLRDGALAPGDTVALVGSGVGYNMAAVALRLTASRAFATART